jgi:hypothetical protein
VLLETGIVTRLAYFALRMSDRRSAGDSTWFSALYCTFFLLEKTLHRVKIVHALSGSPQSILSLPSRRSMLKFVPRALVLGIEKPCRD